MCQIFTALVAEAGINSKIGTLCTPAKKYETVIKILILILVLEIVEQFLTKYPF